MDAIPVPDEVKHRYPRGETKVFLPPNGDMLDNTVRSAEVIVDVEDSIEIHGVPSLHMYFELDDEDLADMITEGKRRIELTILGVQMPPVAMRIVQMACHSCGQELPRRTKLCHCWLEERRRLEDRFYEKTELIDGCLLWTGAKDKNGYGRFNYNGENIPAYRLAWFFMFEEWPFQLNHKCENPPCIRTFHLENVTNKEHADFTFRQYAHHKCPKGHDKVFYPSKGKYGRWDCRICNINRMRRNSGYTTWAGDLN